MEKISIKSRKFIKKMKNPQTPKKTHKTPKNPGGLGFFSERPGFFPTTKKYDGYIALLLPKRMGIGSAFSVRIRIRKTTNTKSNKFFKATVINCKRQKKVDSYIALLFH